MPGFLKSGRPTGIRSHIHTDRLQTNPDNEDVSPFMRHAKSSCNQTNMLDMEAHDKCNIDGCKYLLPDDTNMLVRPNPNYIGYPSYSIALGTSRGMSSRLRLRRLPWLIHT